MPKPTSVAAVALVDDLLRPTRMLAARRTEPPATAGRWEFPGGKVEPGESPADAARREVLEELGVRVELGDPVLPEDRPGGAWPLRPGLQLYLWWAVALPGEPEPAPLEDHDALRWLTTADLSDVPWLESNRAVLARVARALHTGAGPRA